MQIYSETPALSSREQSRPDAATVAAKKAEIAARYAKRKRHKLPFHIAIKRVAELRALYLTRYGTELPDDDAGRDDARLMADHVAACPNAMPEHIRTMCRQWCPWMDDDEVDRLTIDVMRSPQRYTADTLAKRLGLTAAERSKLDLRTIGAIDLPKAERKARSKDLRRQRNKAYRARKRIAKGSKTRAEYEANSLTRTKPWEALGMSRTRWYELGKPTGRTSTEPHNLESNICVSVLVRTQSQAARLWLTGTILFLFHQPLSQRLISLPPYWAGMTWGKQPSASCQWPTRQRYQPALQGKQQHDDEVSCRSGVQP
jgi:hypothetical protein